MFSSAIQSNPNNIFPPTGKRETTRFSNSENKSFFQPYSANSTQQDDLKQELTDQQWASTEKTQRQRQWIEGSSDLIESHVDKRTQLFFQQAILCYKTPFYFEAEGAEDQIGSGRTVTVEGNTFKTQAAHSSTLPCLYAYPRNIDGTPDTSKKIVFLRHSHSYNLHNSTVELPISVNQTDTYIDGKKSQKEQLRSRTLNLINQVALGNLNPEKATIKFLKNFIVVLKTSLDNLKSDDLRYFIVKKFYLPRVNQSLAELNYNPEFFDQILGVNLNTQDQQVLIRKIVYRERFKLIQKAQDIESIIAKRVLEAQNKIFPKRQKISLKNIDNDLRLAILSKSRSSLQRRLSKLFCTSTGQLLSSFNDKTKSSKIKNNKSFSQKHKKVISDLLREIRASFRELEHLEFSYRSQLLRNLRTNFKDWTQKKLVEVFKQYFPAEPMSQSMVSRLEQVSQTPRSIIYKTPESQRRKELDVSKAEKIAQVLGIDLGLFLPSLITSEELA